MLHICCAGAAAGEAPGAVGVCGHQNADLGDFHKMVSSVIMQVRQLEKRLEEAAAAQKEAQKVG